MPQALRLAPLVLLAAARAWGVEEPAVANRNLAAVIMQLKTGDWSARIHAVHELEYLQSEGLHGLALATEDGDWQVRMTAVHALGSYGVERAPILNKALKYEPCPVVRLMILHNLGSMGPEGEEAKALWRISDAISKEVNACQDQPGPRPRPFGPGTDAAEEILVASSRAPRTASGPRRAAAPARPAAPAPEEQDDAVVTSDPVPPAPRIRPKEDLPAPTKFQRHIELDALLDMSTAPVSREHVVSAPGLIMKDAGGKAPHDALPGLLRALKRGDVRTRARAADDLGHLGATGAPAVPALLAALGDRSARVRSSAGLALGNIGAVHAGVVPPLTEALKDRSEDVRYAAALALSRIDSLEARDAFNRHVGKEARRAIDRPKATGR